MGSGKYGTDLTTLMDAKLIDSVLGAGTKDGYSFVSGGSAVAFTVTAGPITKGSTGTRYFFSDESGVIRYSTSGIATTGSSPLGQ